MLDLRAAAAAAANLKLLTRMDWPQLQSPCLREHITIGVQLGFLGILLLHLLRKCVDLAFNGGAKTTDQGKENYHIGLEVQQLLQSEHGLFDFSAGSPYLNATGAVKWSRDQLQLHSRSLFS